MFDPGSAFMSWVMKIGLDKAYKTITAWFCKSTGRGVLIIGPGGVGKTTLGHFLSGQEDKTASGSYLESVSTEEFRLTGDIPVQVIIPPGQSHRRKATWDQRLEDVTSGKFRGVILIHAYGHHAIGDISYENHKLYSPDKGLDAFATEYILDCIKTEEKILSLVCDAIKQCAEPIWLLTLILKEDLWWNERENVMHHYSNGKYGKITKECLGRKTERFFRHEISYASLVIRNLSTGRNEIIKRTVAGYDSRFQDASLKNLLRVFTGLMNWEKEHGI